MKALLIRTLFLLVFFIVSCNNENNKDVQSIHVRNKQLLELINGFVTTLPKESNVKVITAFFQLKMDTLFVNLIHSYPDFDVANFQGIYVSKTGTRIIFLGDDVPKEYFIKLKSATIPKELVEKKQAWKNDIRSAAMEPEMWSFYFINQLLIKYSPEKEIKKILIINKGRVS